MADFMFQNMAYRATVYRTGGIVKVNSKWSIEENNLVANDIFCLVIFVIIDYGSSGAIVYK